MTAHRAEPAERPDVIVADTLALVQLATASRLHLLHDIGRAVVIVDKVADAATRPEDETNRAVIGFWISAGLTPGTDRPVQIASTGFGESIAQARRTDPDFHVPRPAEVAELLWLASAIQCVDRPTTVIYGGDLASDFTEPWLPRFRIDRLTTRALLDVAEAHGLIASADDDWARANPGARR